VESTANTTAFVYRRIPSKELDAKSTTPLAGRVITPTRPLPTPAVNQQHNCSPPSAATIGCTGVQW